MKSLKNMVQEALGTPSGVVGHRIQISHLTNAQRQYIEIYCKAKQVGGYPETTVYEFPSFEHAEKVLQLFRRKFTLQTLIMELVADYYQILKLFQE